VTLAFLATQVQKDSFFLPQRYTSEKASPQASVNLLNSTVSDSSYVNKNPTTDLADLGRHEGTILASFTAEIEESVMHAFHWNRSEPTRQQLAKERVKQNHSNKALDSMFIEMAKLPRTDIPSTNHAGHTDQYDYTSSTPDIYPESISPEENLSESEMLADCEQRREEMRLRFIESLNQHGH